MVKLATVLKFAGKWRSSGGTDYYVVQIYRNRYAYNSNMSLPELEAWYASGEDVEIPGIGKFLPKEFNGRLHHEMTRFPGKSSQEIFWELIRESEED